jgi:hypothetical protein
MEGARPSTPQTSLGAGGGDGDGHRGKPASSLPERVRRSWPYSGSKAKGIPSELPLDLSEIGAAALERWVLLYSIIRPIALTELGLMREEELLQRLRNSEDGFVERKSSFDQREAREAIVAFANSAHLDRPGLLFIGVRPDGSIQGVKDPDTLARDSVDKLCKEQCFPPITYTTAAVRADGLEVLAIIVPLSENRPHFAGNAFIREGSRTKKASNAAFEEMIASRNTKAGALLRMKGQTVSVQVRGKQIGEAVFESHFSHDYEAKVVACDAHSVTLHLLSSGRNVAEPLEYILITVDTRWHSRPLLLIRAPT